MLIASFMFEYLLIGMALGPTTALWYDTVEGYNLKFKWPAIIFFVLFWPINILGIVGYMTHATVHMLVTEVLL
jgi:hypothetical protein